jgi:ribosomal protein S18 acetylase RimI-like enzyme
MAHLLDNPVLASLAGPHAHLAQRRGNVLCYPRQLSPFVSVPARPTAADWADVAGLAGPGAAVLMAGVVAAPPGDWEFFEGIGVQMVDDGVAAAPDDEAVRLGSADVPEMLALVARTDPGPFETRTIELGTYLGIRRDGALIAMAGERLHPPGWTEISAVCTDATHQGQGLATRLIRAIVAGIRHRGETPFLHAAAHNTGAILLYEKLGFQLRRRLDFALARVPAAVPP